MKFQASRRGPAALALALGLLAPVAGRTAAPPPPAVPPAPAYAAADWKRVDPANLLVIDTTKGRVVVELAPALAPEHVARIKDLAHQGYYDGLKFFRVIDNFMVQTGDKANTGAGESGVPTLKGTFNFRRSPDMPFAGAKNPRGGTFGFMGPMPVYTQPDELAALTADGKVKAWAAYCPGVAGMARTADENSASAQFFLMRQAFPTLEDQYTAWGRVVAGLDVVRAIAVGEPPPNPDAMTRVRMVADLPAAERPDVWRIDPASADFRAHMDAVAAARGAQFTPCDIDVPSEIRK
ncbi:MAG TPA: peptidylprolyl isomerase [Caulobacteraceae bacterium]|jgi:peptidylprolyl isomerase|nr:peptidylprolyl isomerase [Caulobacteraceae bacterium]